MVCGKPPAVGAEASAFTFKTAFAGTPKVSVHSAGHGMTTGFSAFGGNRWWGTDEAIGGVFGTGLDPELASPGVSLGLAGGVRPDWVPPVFFFKPSPGALC